MVKKKFIKNNFWDILQGFTAAILWGYIVAAKMSLDTMLKPEPEFY